jgi:hypothetical protein
MKKISDDELRERLLESNYPNDEVILRATIESIRNLGSAAGAVFENWYATGKISGFEEIEGITPDFLRERHNMEDVGIIIAYDMLSKDGKSAAHLLKRALR